MLRVLILGVSGVHHTLVAAHMLMDSFNGELNAINGYCNSELDVSGYPIYVGKDRYGNELYTLGAGGELEIAKKALGGLLQLFENLPYPLLITEIRVKGEIWIRLGAALSRVPFGSWLNAFISARVIKGQLASIQSQAKQVQSQIDWLSRSQDHWEMTFKQVGS